ENGVNPFVGAPSWSSRLGMLYDSGAKILLGDETAAGGVTGIRVGRGCTFTPVWRSAFGTGTQPAPLVLGDALFAVGGYAGACSMLDARSGKRIWTFETDADTLAPPNPVRNASVAARRGAAVRLLPPPR